LNLAENLTNAQFIAIIFI